ncbi:MAG: hypothetical protein JRN45_00560 [Nitrososphaerota archaeon]|nr:hypothetical protein [Nitrososphaerota archaeon]
MPASRNPDRRTIRIGDDYGRLPPKKLARLKELVDKGLGAHGLPEKEVDELARLYVEAGGELPSGIALARGRLRRASVSGSPNRPEEA